jgi:hypothetical protein
LLAATDLQDLRVKIDILESLSDTKQAIKQQGLWISNMEKHYFVVARTHKEGRKGPGEL